MNKKFIGYGRQYIDERDIDAVTEALRGDFLTQGPAVDLFEKRLAEKVGVRYAVAVNSGTAALHVACMAAELKPGLSGVTSSLTFVASANAIKYCGADPYVLDVESETLCFNAKTLDNFLKKSTNCKVVIPVHYAGLAIDSKEIRKVSGDRIVIEDACHALGGSYHDGKPIGSCAYSDMTVFSFHPVKTITTGEGGAVTTNDESLYRTLKLLRSHGIEKSPEFFMDNDSATEDGGVAPWYYEQQYLGYNYRLSDISAALGISQLEKLDMFISRRREIAIRYDDAFRELPNVTIPQSEIAMRGRSGHHLYVLLIDFAAMSTTRTEFMNLLRENAIGSQVHYIPVYRQPYYRDFAGYESDNFPTTEKCYQECLSFPLYPAMTDDDVLRVIDVVRDAIKGQLS